jgi:hypothetical protein
MTAGREVPLSNRWMHKPPIGMWVVELTHVIRGGEVRAIGKVLGYCEDGGVELELLDGSQQKWHNAAFVEIHQPDERLMKPYRELSNIV